MASEAVVSLLDFGATVGFLVAVGIGLQQTRDQGIDQLFWLVFIFTTGLASVWMALSTIEWIGIQSTVMDLFTNTLQAVVIGSFGVGVIGTHVVVQNLKQSRAETVRQASIVAVFSRVLRHNLRNDLNVVRAHLEMLEDPPQDHPINVAAVDKIDDLLELADTARDIESIANSNPDRQPVELTSLVENVIRQVAQNYPSASVTVECPNEVFMEARPTVRTALEELIENAAKHAGMQPTVTVSIETSADVVSLTISDDGPGLPEQERAVLQVGSESKLMHGSGLGLWLSYYIVTNHDGSIDTEVTDAGSRVTVRLPRQSAPAEVVDDKTLLDKFHREQDRFEAVFKQAFDAMALIDDDGRYIEVNESFADLLGLSKKELHGRSIEEFVADVDTVLASWEEVQADERRRDTYTLVTTRGVEKVVEYTAVSDIVPGQHLTILRNITSRKEREQKLAQAETIFEQAQDAMFLINVTDGEFLVERVNEAYEELTSLSTADIQGKTPREIVGDEVGAEIEARYSECVRRRETIEYEKVIPIDGEQRYWETKLSPVVEDGSVVRLVGATRDVTDRKQRERQLQQERERFERLLKTSPVGIAILDSSGAFVRANDRAEEVLGLSKSEITNREYDDPGWEIVDAAGNPIPAADLPFRRVIETGRPLYEYEMGIRVADGSLRWLSVNAAPVTSDSEIERVIAVITDHTDQHEDER